MVFHFNKSSFWSTVAWLYVVTFIFARFAFSQLMITSFLVDSIEKQITEFEWRLQVQAEPYTLTLEEEAEEEEEEF